MQFDSIKDTAAYFNVTISNISLMLESGNIGRKGKMRGYKFEYIKGKRITIHKRVTTIENTAKAGSE